MAHTFSIIPSLNYNIEPNCNMKCTYCPKYYENYQEVQGSLDNNIIKNIFFAAFKEGISTFRLSGGEPLLNVEKVIQLSNSVKKYEGFKNLNFRLNTNGYLLKENAEKLHNAGINVIKVSLDTLDHNKFCKITGIYGLNKVLDGIDTSMNLGIHVELNMVYFRENMKDFWRILDYCVKKRISVLKILDLVNYEDSNFWESNYINPTQLIRELHNKYGHAETQKLHGGRGVEMLSFQVSKDTKVLIKDSCRGSTYSKVFCDNCPYFPCQEGFYTLTINTDGKLKPCRLRKDLFIDLRALLQRKSSIQQIDITRTIFHDLLQNYYSEVQYLQCWEPSLPKRVVKNEL